MPTTLGWTTRGSRDQNPAWSYSSGQTQGHPEKLASRREGGSQMEARPTLS